MSGKNEMNLSKIREELMNAKSLTEVQDIMEGNGFNWDEARAKEFTNEELSEDELTSVSGGGDFFGSLINILTGGLSELLKDFIDRKTVEKKICTYSDDGNTRTCVTKTDVTW